MSEPKTTTLAKIREFGPCTDGWVKLLKHLGKTEADGEPLLMSTILKSNGLDDAIWCLRVFYDDYRQSVVEFACDCAERVLGAWESWAEKNAPEHLAAPRKAIEAARSGDKDAAYAAARAAADARDAYAAADAAYAAAADAYAAARAAADAARDARAAYAAYAAAYAAARAAADARDARAAYADAEQIEQEKLLIKHFG